MSLNYYVHSSFIHNDQMSSKLWYILTEKYYLATKRIKLLVRQHGIILKKKKKNYKKKKPDVRIHAESTDQKSGKDLSNL